MIEITRRRAGRCEYHKQQPAEYQITGDEWVGRGGQPALCQECMIGLAQNDDINRAVLLIQSATRG